MSLIRRTVAVLGAIALTFTALPSQATTPINTKYVEGTDLAAAMYNPLVVNEFNLVMPQTTIDGLNGSTNYWGNEGPYLPAKLSGKVNGIPFASMDVGVHLKGAWGSWRNIYGKSGFKIKIDFVNKTQNLYGVTKLTLNNMVQDHSSTHETLSYRLFRAVGVPTARTGYANVTVNGANYGLHLNIETVDTKLLNHWGITPSHIYKGGVPNFPEVVPGQEPAFAVDQGSTTDETDLTALMAVVGRGNGPNWFTDMSRVADLQEMTLDWAAEKFTGHWDGYANNRNNFFLVNRQDGKFIMLPWGMDQTLNGGLDYWSGNAMISQCINDTRCQNLYKQALVKVIHTAKDLNLPLLSTETAAAINPALQADPKKEFDFNEAPGLQSNARSFVTSQISNGLSMIASYDTYLKTFSAPGQPATNASEVMKVSNGTKSIQLSGIAYANGTTVTPSPLTPLAVGMNTIPLMVTLNASQVSQTTYVKVYRMAAITKVANLVYSANSSALTAKASTLVTQLGQSAANSSHAVLTIKMQPPASMSAARQIALIRSRAQKIQTILSGLGIAPEKVSLVITKVKGVDTASVTLSYQR
jgi:hypothetical protein